MRIERIQVEEGFLDGLDLYFQPGLNVLIGPRGSGKTSVIELIRFCLGSPSYSDESKALDHAKSVLKSGRVTVTLEEENETIIVSRSTAKNSWTQSAPFNPPLIFSQNEIETIAVSEQGRLRLIDGFRESAGDSSEEQEELKTQIRALMVEMQTARIDIDELQLRIEELRDCKAELDVLVEEEAKFKEVMEASREQQVELEALTKQLAVEAAKRTSLERAQLSIQRWSSKATELTNTPLSIEDWSSTAGEEDLLTSVRSELAKISKNVRAWIGTLSKPIGEINEMLSGINNQILKLEDRARELRRHLEKMREGAGDLAKRIAEARAKIALQLDLTGKRAKQILHLEKLQEQRRKYLDQIEEHREQAYRERKNVADSLNKLLGPRILVTIQRAASHTEYIDALSAALRGTGLHYNTLTPLIAQRMSPREFVEAVETVQVETIAELVDIPKPRAEKLISQIKSESLEEILLAHIEDGVQLSLLDGKDYKTTEHLSHGQRCTVVLPILLGTQSESLLVDQPEDHLDNAFIVDTLIKAIQKRKEIGQIIFSTHNANIPVLGGAEQIILLGSDGKRGFEKYSGDLDAHDSVEAISTVMEGGKEAFERRAEYYETLDEIFE